MATSPPNRRKNWGSGIRGRRPIEGAGVLGFIKCLSTYPAIYQVTRSVKRLMGADLSARRGGTQLRTPRFRPTLTTSSAAETGYVSTLNPTSLADRPSPVVSEA